MSYGSELIADHEYELDHGLPNKGITIPSKKERKTKMAQKVLILGDSGTGKSASLRNFKPDEIMVINCAGKPLPFKNHFESVTPSFERLTQDILKAMDKTEKKVIVVDDAQYIMSFQYMRRIKENGWDKWNDIQGDFFNIIKACDYMPEDVIVYFLSHLQRDDEGHEKIKTMGKMLDEKITIEGLFTTVLKTSVKDGQYFFLTQNSGLDTVKSPIGMFPSYAIDNDLKYVDTKIRNYYEIGEYEDDETVEALDKTAEKADISKPDADGKRRRNRKSEVSETRSESRSAAPAATEQKAEEKPVEQPVEKSAETAQEQPKVRRRKARTAPAEEDTAKAETPSETPEKADTGTGTIVGATPAEQKAEEAAEAVDAAITSAPKRRRRRANTVTKEDVTDPELDLFNSDDLPF